MGIFPVMRAWDHGSCYMGGKLWHVPAHMQRIGTDHFIIWLQNTLLYNMSLSCCKVNISQQGTKTCNFTSHCKSVFSSPVAWEIQMCWHQICGRHHIWTTYIICAKNRVVSLLARPGWQKWLCMPLSINLGKGYSSMGEKIRLNWALSNLHNEAYSGFWVQVTGMQDS